jgi:ribose 5-phosphate isomerase B
MKLAIGTDHRGFVLKQKIIAAFSTIMWIDVGAYDDIRSDYPIYARKACDQLSAHAVQGAVLLCGTGVGMSIVANRYPGIYAALAWSAEIARRAKEDDWVNCIVLPADYVTDEQAIAIVTAWLQAHSKPGIYQARIEMIDDI